MPVGNNLNLLCVLFPCRICLQDMYTCKWVIDWIENVWGRKSVLNADRIGLRQFPKTGLGPLQGAVRKSALLQKIIVYHCCSYFLPFLSVLAMQEAALWGGGKVGLSDAPPLWSRLKYFNNLKWIAIQTFMSPKGWILMFLVIPIFPVAPLLGWHLWFSVLINLSTLKMC